VSGDAVVVSVAIVAFASIRIFRGPFGEAVADRIRGAGQQEDQTLAAELAVEVDQLRTRLAEVEERLDFTERLLAQSEQPERLPGRSDQ
jgi:hypothetical protein